MAPLRDFVLDAFSALSHKQALGDGGRTPTARTWLAPSWVGQDEHRRLTAYRIRAAYLANSARHFLAGDIGIQDQAEHREYGDAALLRDRVVGGVLGETWELVVDGADLDLPDEPELPPEPPAPKDDDSDVRKRILALRREMWDAQAMGIIDAWEQSWRDLPALQARQDWLRTWADDEMARAKIVEMEGDAVGLGDGVLALFWRNKQQRATLRVYPPDSYFPVLDDDDTEDWPTKVHLAWEFWADDAQGVKRRFVRRQTWELGPIEGVPDDNGVGLAAGDTIGPDGIQRFYPWAFDDDNRPVASTTTCFFSDGTWPFDVLAARRADDFDEAKAVWAADEDGAVAQRLDLRLDFIPVVHIPNTPDSREHYGCSVIDIVAQILDDLAATDSDVQRAQALAAGPVIALSGAKIGQGDPAHQQVPREVAPGTVWELGPDGHMDVLDLSAGLPAIRESRDDLLDRYSVNGRVPAEALGRVKASEVPSGVALQLSFSPFNQLVGQLRMTRDPKYRLLLKFVQRMAMAAGILPAGRPLPARIAFGSFLPSDEMSLVELVTKLLMAGAISTQTAVTLLIAGGVDIEDARGEVERIRLDHPENARAVADATGSEQAAADYLGIDLPAPAAPPPPPAPVFNLPPAGPPPA